MLIRLVIDASVVIKWYLPEVHSPAAVCLLGPEHELHVPDLLFSEIGNVLWKRMKIDGVSGERAHTIVSALKSFPFSVTEARLLMTEALDISLSMGKTFYDSLYVALARVQQCPLVTADRKLYDTLKKGPFKERVRWVEEVK